MEIIDRIDITEWLKLNAKLQGKKNILRGKLAQKGILKREGDNKFDHYSYFSEAQYKLLFTGLFAECGLELKFTEHEYATFDGSEKQANGRMVRVRFTLTDVETGFFEETDITGEGIDKGDKAGYKAYTGALKYYLADTFMVATGDDPETESPDTKMNTKGSPKSAPTNPAPASDRPASEGQLKILREKYTGDNLAKLLQVNGISSLEEMPMAKASDLIAKLTKKKESGNEN